MTEPSIKYSDYRREVSVERVEVSYNLLTQRTDKTSKKPDKVKLSLRDASQLIRGYTQGRFLEQVRRVAAYLVVFQLFILRQVVEDSWVIPRPLGSNRWALLFMEGFKLVDAFVRLSVTHFQRNSLPCP